MILQLLPATSLQEHATFLWTLITLMIAVNSLQGLSTAGPGKIDTQTKAYLNTQQHTKAFSASTPKLILMALTG